MGDIIYVDIHSTESVKQGESFGTIEAVKTVSDLYAPVSGRVAEINMNVNENPASVNQDPYGEGWIIKLEISDLKEIEKLMNTADYKKLVGEK